MSKHLSFFLNDTSLITDGSVGGELLLQRAVTTRQDMAR